ncbi:MAG: hypothetical protein GSR80_001130 [Desulfurococcales archaeon]|nr:hypothetical protein [Desulfurococcales archaeon]
MTGGWGRRPEARGPARIGPEETRAILLVVLIIVVIMVSIAAASYVLIQRWMEKSQNATSTNTSGGASPAGPVALGSELLPGSHAHV